jgi:CBS domain containing-hemolysin-like protein
MKLYLISVFYYTLCLQYFIEIAVFLAVFAVFFSKLLKLSFILIFNLTAFTLLCQCGCDLIHWIFNPLMNIADARLYIFF